MVKITIYHGPPQRRADRGTGVPRFSVNWFKTRLTRAAKLSGINRGEWSIWLIGDRDMAPLHNRTMKNPHTTDVLTFDFRDAPADPLELQTLVCVDEAARQSTARKNGLRHELLLYMVHSLLHVSGYDDRTKNEANKMHAREDEILTKIGAGSVYAAKKSAPPTAKQSKLRNRRVKPQ